MGPELSVVVVYGPLPERAEGAVRSVLLTARRVRVEILLVRIGPGERPAGSLDPRVRHLEKPARTTFAEARAAAVREARAPVVAFLEEHARVLDGWAEAVLAGHRAGYAGVGAAVRAANPGVGDSDLMGFLAYGLWYEPLERGETVLLPGHNCSFDRDALLSLGDDLAEDLACDLVLHGRLAARGARFLTEPSARLAHLNETSADRLAAGVALFYRTYAVARARAERWNALRRLLYVLATPVIPFWSLALTRRLARAKGGPWPAIVRSGTWRILRVRFAAAWAQALGLVAGEGDARARFSLYELTEPRPSRSDAAGRARDESAAA